MIEISKELLSEVLGEKRVILDYEVSINKTEIHYGHKDINEDGFINIYELAYKCKEWAFIRGYKIESKINEDSCQSHATKRAYLGDKDWAIGFYCETEPQSIFRACEWILNKVSK